MFARLIALTLALVLVCAVPARAATPGPAWDDRASMTMSARQALDALDSLPADSPAARSWGAGGGREGWFGQAWEDVDGDGCDTRNEILGRDLKQADYSRRPGLQGREDGAGQGATGCPDATVWSGVLDDPYTGRRIDFQRGPSTSTAVQIDHVIPLSYLYAHGAWEWNARTRLLAANDPLNLLAVDGRANESKGACGPATCPTGSTESGSWRPDGGKGWWPPSDKFRCDYAARFVSVAAAYRLGLPDADRRALRTALTDCAAGGPSSLSEWGSDLIAGVWDALADRPVLALVCAAGLALLGGGSTAWGRRALRGLVGSHGSGSRGQSGSRRPRR